MDTGERRHRRRPVSSRGLRRLPLLPSSFAAPRAPCSALRTEPAARTTRRDGAWSPCGARRVRRCVRLRKQTCRAGALAGTVAQTNETLSAARREPCREDGVGEASALVLAGRHRCPASAGTREAGPRGLGVAGRTSLCGRRWHASPSLPGARSRPQRRVTGGRAKAPFPLPKGQGRLRGRWGRGRTRRVPSASSSRPERSPATRSPARSCPRRRLRFIVGSW